MAFLSKLATGEITLYRGPVDVAAKCYRHTLVDYPITRALFREYGGDPAPAPWGVPEGTVIAWSPRADAQRRQPDGSVIIDPPQGWVICDGRPGTPNLLDRFIMGTGDANQIASLGGTPNPVHIIVLKQPDPRFNLEDAGAAIPRADGELSNSTHIHDVNFIIRHARRQWHVRGLMQRPPLCHRQVF